MIEETGEFALVTHLQAAAERDKASTARALHDDLGCLMVAAVMDLAWVENNLVGHEDEVRRRLARVRQTLGVAIVAKRKIIEDLRPSLLEDIGLFAALSWQLKAMCARTGLTGSEVFPPSETLFRPEASIALFRIAEEALALVASHDSAKCTKLSVLQDAETITMRFADDGVFCPPHVPPLEESPTLASMRHRIGVLGGTLDIQGSEHTPSSMSVSVPLGGLVLVSGAAAVGTG
jgi:signal transduction histidine kinase